VLGDYCCVPAGGESRPSAATFSTSPPQPGALTLVVWTGGHVAKVEEFAVTGLRAQSTGRFSAVTVYSTAMGTRRFCVSHRRFKFEVHWKSSVAGAAAR
jgi:hypothetical protein